MTGIVVFLKVPPSFWLETLCADVAVIANSVQSNPFHTHSRSLFYCRPASPLVPSSLILYSCAASQSSCAILIDLVLLCLNLFFCVQATLLNWQLFLTITPHHDIAIFVCLMYLCFPGVALCGVQLRPSNCCQK